MRTISRSSGLRWWIAVSGVGGRVTMAVSGVGVTIYDYIREAGQYRCMAASKSIWRGEDMSDGG